MQAHLPHDDDGYDNQKNPHKKSYLREMLRNTSAFIPAALALVPGLVLLGQVGVLNVTEFFDGILAKDPLKLTATGLTFVGAAQAVIAREVVKAKNSQQKGDAELLRAHRADAREIKNILSSMGRMNETIISKAAQSDQLYNEVRLLKERVTSGGHEEPDTDRLWNTRPKTSMTSLNPVWGREVNIVRSPDGIKFEGTSRIRDVILPRVEEGTALSDWRIICRLSASPFSEIGLLPLKKLLFIEQELRDIARRENRKECIDKVVRISIITGGVDNLKSLFHFVSDTPNGPEEVVLKYYRHPASNANLSEAGDLFRYHGESDIEKAKSECNQEFFDGIRVTFAELRAIVENGRWPNSGDGSVISGDHWRF